MFNLTGYKRYFLRELLPRAISIGVCTFFLMPLTPGLAFHGGVGWALFAAVVSTVNFWLWGSIIMGALSVRNFVANIDSNFWTGVLYAATLLVFPLTAIAFLQLAASAIFVCTAWYGLLAWIVGLNVCCALTHDYGTS